MLKREINIFLTILINLLGFDTLIWVRKHYLPSAFNLNLIKDGQNPQIGQINADITLATYECIFFIYRIFGKIITKEFPQKLNYWTINSILIMTWIKSLIYISTNLVGRIQNEMKLEKREVAIYPYKNSWVLSHYYIFSNYFLFKS